MSKKLLEKIKEFDIITIFRHIRPDNDAALSQMAMYNFLKDNFPNKKIYACGHDKLENVTIHDNVTDEDIANSLAIVLDSATSKRIDDNRFSTAKYIVKIDHHPVVDKYGDLRIEKPKYASCAEVLAEILMSRTFKDYFISKKVYSYLYCGILYDTQGYTISTTTYKTLYIGSQIAKRGNLEISSLCERVTNIPLDEFNKVTDLRERLIVKDRFGYVIITKKDLKELDMTADMCKEHIDEFKEISDINIWCMWVYNEETDKYNCSSRSRRGYVINKIAEKYHGGGHENAAGMRDLTEKDIEEQIEIYAKLSIKS